MKNKTLELLACPRCYGQLEYRPKLNAVVCLRDRLAFPIRKGVPILLEMDARVLDTAETNKTVRDTEFK
jgi:hypothetical protein